MPGPNVSLITFAPNTTIKSGDVNANFAALNGAGGYTVTQPDTLAPGNQETGYVGVSASNPIAGQNVGIGANFKTVLTNTPTGITLTVDSSGQQNIASAHVSNFSVYGFNSFFIVSASGTQSFWHGMYTTQGNCLLAVDTVAQTFDHHCDACGNVARGALIGALQVVTSMGAQPGGLALSYVCAACGSVECFNSGLGSAAETNPTPQGAGPYATTYGAQAQRVRAIQVALGYAINA